MTTSSWNDLPIELVELILDFIPRCDAESLRCTSKSFERKVSPAFFRSVVVPFNSELQAMVRADIHLRNGEYSKGKGKRLAVDDDDSINEHSTLPWIPKPSSSQDDPYRGHGYKVFRGFGRHIRNFGMSFEVTEDDLRRPPAKQLLDLHESFHGNYEWPPIKYRRFDKLAAIESAADEISHLRIAMAYLVNVKALGLSLNSGHGWLSGRDRHPEQQRRSRPVIFGRTFPAYHHDHIVSNPDDFDEYDSTSLATMLRAPTTARSTRTGRLNAERALRVVMQHMAPRAVPFGVPVPGAILAAQPEANGNIQVPANANPNDVWQTALRAANLPDDPAQAEIWRQFYHQVTTNVRQGVPRGGLNPENEWIIPFMFGILGVTEGDGADDDDRGGTAPRTRPIDRSRFRRVSVTGLQPEDILEEPTSALSPAKLTQTQKEWLVEADWAQRAFLQSFMLSTVDNKAIFHNVKSFTFASLSSHYIPMLCRSDFWNAFNELETLVLRVLPDWRQLERSAHEIAETKVLPSASVNSVYWLLVNFVGTIPSLVNLHVGWARDAEQAMEGEVAAAHYLPAPVCRLDDIFAASSTSPIQLPHVQHLTLSNSFIDPKVLKAVARSLGDESLEILTLRNTHLIARRSPRFLRRVDITDRLRRFLPDHVNPVIRHGSWTATINDLTPGAYIDMESEERAPRLESNLERIELDGCGYALCNALPEREVDDNPMIGNAGWVPAPPGNPYGHFGPNMPPPGWQAAGAPLAFPPPGHMGPPALPPPRLANAPPLPTTVAQAQYLQMVTQRQNTIAATRAQRLQQHLQPNPNGVGHSVRALTMRDGVGNRDVAVGDGTDVMRSNDSYLGNVVYETFTEEWRVLRNDFGLRVEGVEAAGLQGGRWLAGDGSRIFGVLQRQ